MKRRAIVTIFLCFTGFLHGHAASPAARPAWTEADAKWLDRLIPHPKKIGIDGSIKIPASGIFLSLPDVADPRLRTARRILEPFSHGKGGFEISLVLSLSSGECPGDIRESLRAVPNKDQAYAIKPMRKSRKFSGLVLAADTPLGLLYAARTLAQLVGPVLPASGTATAKADARVEIPEVTILDWPDLSERGEWGGDAARDLAWMAERKLNIVEVHPELGFNDDGSPRASLDAKMLDEAQGLGVKIVPIILHLEQLAGTGLFKHHPDVAAVPEPGKPIPTDYTPGVCFSKDKTVDLLAGWMKLLLGLPGIDEVDVWLSEVEAGCFCETCKGRNPFVLETEGIHKAFDKVRAARPDASLRILLTQASYDSNEKVLSAVRPDTKVIYYDGGKTYDSSHKPMIYPLLENFARNGHWLGVYPQLTNSWRTVFPFSGPQFMRARMKEFADKGLSSMIGYATPSNRYYEFNITAAAEWSWNGRGRSESEFARVYAVRAGIPDPDRFADWAVTIGEVGWKLAGSRSVEKFVFSAGNSVFLEGRITEGSPALAYTGLKFGREFLDEFRDRAVFEEGKAQAERALKLAETIGYPAAVAESRSVLGTLCLLSGLTEYAASKPAREAIAERQASLSDPGPAAASGLKKKAAGKDIKKGQVSQSPNGFEEKARAGGLAERMAQLDVVTGGLVRAVYDWGTMANPLPRNKLASRFRDTVDFAAHVMDALWQDAAGQGLRDPHPEYRSRPAVEWETRHFADSTEATLWADITEMISGPGEYDAILRFLDGNSGVTTRSVALLAGKDRETARLLDEDRWTFRIGRWDRYVDYWLSFSKEAAESLAKEERIFLKVELTGPDLTVPRDRRTTHGRVGVRKSWRKQDNALFQACGINIPLSLTLSRPGRGHFMNSIAEKDH